MTGGDVCPICTSATKYKYIMEELVDSVKELQKEFQKHRDEVNTKLVQQHHEISKELKERDIEFREQLALIAESCATKTEEQSKWIIDIIIGLLGIALGAFLTWRLG